MRSAAVAIVAALLAACATEPAGPPTVDWRTWLTADAVLVEVTDPQAYYRVREVRLIDPAGRQYPAREIERRIVQERDYGGGAGVALGGGWGSASGGALGMGVTVPLTGGPRPGAMSVTEARIRIPDFERYRRTAEGWRVGVTLVGPGEAESYTEFPAPRPAAAP